MIENSQTWGNPLPHIGAPVRASKKVIMHADTI